MKIGDKFGRWTVIGEPFLKGKQSRKYVPLLCVCGTKRIVRVDGIENGRSKSCGCFQRNRIHHTVLVRPDAIVFGF